MTDKSTSDTDDLGNWYNPMKHTLEEIHERASVLNKRLRDVDAMSIIEFPDKAAVRKDLEKELALLKRAESLRTEFASDPGKVRGGEPESSEEETAEKAPVSEVPTAKPEPLAQIPTYSDEALKTESENKPTEKGFELPDELVLKLDELDSLEEELEGLAERADTLSNTSSMGDLLSISGRLSDKFTAYKAQVENILNLIGGSESLGEEVLPILANVGERSSSFGQMFEKKHSKLLSLLDEVIKREAENLALKEKVTPTEHKQEISATEIADDATLNSVFGNIDMQDTPEAEKSENRAVVNIEELAEADFLDGIGFTELEARFDPILAEISALKPGSESRKAKLMDFVIDYGAAEKDILKKAVNETEARILRKQFYAINQALQEVWNETFSKPEEAEQQVTVNAEETTEPGAQEETLEEIEIKESPKSADEDSTGLTEEEKAEIEKGNAETEQLFLELLDSTSQSIRKRLAKTLAGAEKAEGSDKHGAYLAHEEALVKAESELSTAISVVGEDPKFKKYADLLSEIRVRLEEARLSRFELENSESDTSREKPESKQKRIQNLKLSAKSLLDQYFLAEESEAKTLKHDKGYWEETLSKLISLVSAIDELDEFGKKENSELRAIAKEFIEIANLHKTLIDAEKRNREDKIRYQGLLDEGVITESDYEAVVGSLIHSKKLVDLADAEIDQIERLHRGDLAENYGKPGGEEELRDEIARRKQSSRRIVEQIEERQLWLKGIVDEARAKTEKAREEKERNTNKALDQMGQNSDGRLKRLASSAGKEVAETAADMALAVKKGMEKLGWKGRAGVSAGLVGLALTGTVLGGTAGATLMSASYVGGLAMRMSSALVMSVAAHSISGRFTDDKIWKGAAAIGGGVVSFFVLPEIVKYGMHESGLSDWLGGQFNSVKNYFVGDSPAPPAQGIKIVPNVPRTITPSLPPTTASVSPSQPTPRAWTTTIVKIPPEQITPTHPTPPVSSVSPSQIPTQGDFDIDAEPTAQPFRPETYTGSQPPVVVEKIPDMPPPPPKPQIAEVLGPKAPVAIDTSGAGHDTTAAQPRVSTVRVRVPITESVPDIGHAAPDVSHIELDKLHYPNPETSIVGPRDTSWNYIRQTISGSGLSSTREVENITGNIVRRMDFLSSHPNALHDTLVKIGKEGLKELKLTENSSYKEVLRALGYQGNNPSLRNIYDGAKAPNIKGLMKIVGGEEQLKKWVTHAHELITRAGLK